MRNITLKPNYENFLEVFTILYEFTDKANPIIVCTMYKGKNLLLVEV